MTHKSVGRAQTLRAAPMLFMVVSACTSPPHSDDIDVDQMCGTGTPEMTSGGDHGVSWAEVNFPDVPEYRLDVAGSAYLDEDPVRWEYDPSGDVHYRSPTALELEANEGWTAEDLLVVPNPDRLRELRSGRSQVKLTLPLLDPGQGRPQVDLDLVDINLTKHGTHQSLSFLEVYQTSTGAPGRRSFRPRIYFYGPRTLQLASPRDAIASVFVTDFRGSMSIEGLRSDRRFEVRGPYQAGRDVVVELPLPSSARGVYLLRSDFEAGTDLLLPTRPGGIGLVTLEQGAFDIAWQAKSRAANAAMQCADGLDNDKDGVADGCDFACVEHPDFGTTEIPNVVRWEYGKHVGFFGDVEFCTREQDAYPALMMQWSMTATMILNSIDPPAPYAPEVRVPPFRVVMAGCTIADDVETARACSREGACPGSLADYPLSSLGGKWGVASGGVFTGILGRTWEFVDYVVGGQDATEVHPIHAAVVTAWQGDTAGLVMGKATIYNPGSGPAFAGAAVVWAGSIAAGPGRSLGATIAHELGHTLGLAHDGAGIQKGVGYWPGIMRSSGGVAPILEWDAPSAADPDVWTQGDVWKTLTPSKWAPRPSGFRFQGCNTNHDCHAGFSCNNQGYCE